jgi:addiction module HigA family antidote
MIRVPTDREPIHPGEVLRKEFLLPMKITQQQLADAIYVPFQRINELVNGKRGVTPSTSLRFAKFFGVTEDFWMNLQIRWDICRAKKKEQDILKKIALARKQPADEQT